MSQPLIQQRFYIGEVRAELSTFDNGTDVKEYHLLLHIESETLAFAAQLDQLFNAYETIRTAQLPKPVAVFKRYFLSDAANQEAALMNYILESDDCAISVVQQPPLGGGKIALWAYLQTNVQTRCTPEGLYEVKHGEYTHLWNGSARIMADNSAAQTTLLLNQYVMQLHHAQCTLEANCVRTWFFVHDIDNHYAGVVTARNEVFVEQNLTKDTHFIASTGIAGRSADSKHLVQLDNYAVKGINASQVCQLYAPTHLNRTSDYGVSFERGTSVSYGDRKHVFISGTASIDNRGEVLYVGQIKQQTLRMWDNVEALLKESGCGFEDVVHFIVYLRDFSDFSLVRQLFSERFPSVPAVFLLAPVCRPTWLIEMECMAIKAETNDAYKRY